jgi:hypothetical protein
MIDLLFKAMRSDVLTDYQQQDTSPYVPSTKFGRPSKYICMITDKGIEIATAPLKLLAAISGFNRASISQLMKQNLFRYSSKLNSWVGFYPFGNPCQPEMPISVNPEILILSSNRKPTLKVPNPSRLSNLQSLLGVTEKTVLEAIEDRRLVYSPVHRSMFRFKKVRTDGLSKTGSAKCASAQIHCYD